MSHLLLLFLQKVWLEEENLWFFFTLATKAITGKETPPIDSTSESFASLLSRAIPEFPNSQDSILLKKTMAGVKYCIWLLFSQH